MSNPSTKNDFTKLEGSVEEVLKENKLQAVLYFSRIYKHWEVIVGSPLATKTSPAKLVKKTLIVNVEDAAYSHHLKYYEKKILELIASPEICGKGVVYKIVFQVGKKSILAASKTAAQLQETESASAQNQIKRQAQQTADQITDKRLGLAFSRFMSKNLPETEA